MKASRPFNPEAYITVEEALAYAAELEAVLQQLSGDDFYLTHSSDMHDVGAMQEFIQNFAKSTLNRVGDRTIASPNSTEA